MDRECTYHGIPRPFDVTAKNLEERNVETLEHPSGFLEHQCWVVPCTSMPYACIS